MTNRKKSKIEDPSKGVFSITEMDIERIDQREREYTMLRFAELKEQAMEIEDLRDRLTFWSESQLEYRNRVQMDKFSDIASGAVSYAQGGRMLWLDILCENEMYNLKNQIQHLPKDSTSSEPPLIDVKKVVHLYELGVIEFLEKRLNTASAISLGHVVARITGCNSDTAGRYISRIENGGKIDENNFLVAREWILNRYGKMKPMPDIKFDKDLE